MPKKLISLLVLLAMMGLTAACGAAEEAPIAIDTEATAAPATPTPEPTQAPVEEDIEEVTTPTPEPTATPAPEPTPTEAVSIALTAAEAYELSSAEAEAWQEDAVLTELATTLTGPLTDEGQSEAWSVKYWSPSAQQINSMIFLNGQLNATAVDIPLEQRPIENVESLVLDTQAIYETAAGAGGSDYLGQNYNAAASLTPYPLDITIPTWYVNYQDPDTSTVAFTVIIDARSGEVIQAIATE